MTDFNTYARRVDELAKNTFEEYAAAEAELKEAEAAKNKYPRRMVADAAYMVQSARAEADYLEAKQKMETVRRDMDACNGKIAAIRQELSASLESEYSADPAQVDGNTLELLKSGILHVNDYSKLMNDAQAAGNTTMARLIAKYASDAAETASREYGPGDHRTVELRFIANKGNTAGGKDKLDAFDALADVLRRTVNNTGMISHWDRLTADLVESF